jgi:NAD(P)H dehydrogenase (quinone)
MVAMSPTIAIVYHSGFGHTRVIANSIQRVAEEMGADARLFNVTDLNGNQEAFNNAMNTLSHFDAIIFGCPTYMGGPSAEFKNFMDKTSRIWFNQGWANKIAAGFTCSGLPSGDKLATLQALAGFAAQHSMIWVPQGHIAANEGAGEQDVNRLGGFLGNMSQAGQVPPDQEPGHADIVTAEAFGRRIVAAAQRWRRGAPALNAPN